MGSWETPDSCGSVDSNRDGGKSYYLKLIFANESDMDDFEYVMGETTVLRMMAASWVQSAW